MEEKENVKKHNRYSKPVKALILLVLIASTIISGIGGSWLLCGLQQGMTFREASNPVLYENSKAVGVYLCNESMMIMDALECGEIELVSGDMLETEEPKGYVIHPYEITNALLWIRNLDDNTVYTNVEAWAKRPEMTTETLLSWLNTTSFCAKDSNPCYSFQDFTNENQDWISTLSPEAEAEASIVPSHVYDALEAPTQYQVLVALNTNYPVKGSEAYRLHQVYQYYRDSLGASVYRTMLSIVTFVALALAILMLVLLGLQAGHNTEDTEIHGNLFDRFPIELWMLSDVILIIIGICIAGEGFNRILHFPIGKMTLFVEGVGWITTGWCIFMLTLAKAVNIYLRRAKQKDIGGSIIRLMKTRIAKAANTIFTTFYTARKDSHKTIIRYAVIFFVNLLLFVIEFVFLDRYAPVLIVIVLILIILWNLYMLYYLVKNNNGRDEIRTGLGIIADGNLDYQIPVEGMTVENTEMAREVNRIRDGLKLAVQAQVKSERLKTDLIANVSHDIKTPLTSIINYVDILKRENIEDEKIRGYIDILERKSARLKQLTDDLIEVSKINSGNISLEWSDINLKQLVKQINGEFEEKFQARQLQLICNLPEEQMLIRADGSRLCRVIENLYNNVAKYAMPGSRVYVNGELQAGKAVFSIKNMSEFPLNINADELMERFVRGDSARTTEGSGLGLEIARNLTVMQNGTFDLYVDGDLFKVTITFDEIK